MTYIDTELAKLHRSKSSATSKVDVDGTASVDEEGKPLNPDGRQPASLGRIHEIDLGPDSTARNIALTEAAHHRRHLLRQGIDPDAEKPRLRRDGKPFRRKRRNSNDMKRDRLVEEVLKESNLQIYDDKHATNQGNSTHKGSAASAGATGMLQESRNQPQYASPSPSSEDEEAADDRLAEQFRRDFMEQVYARRRQRQPIPGSARAKAREQKSAPDYVSKGPKLGGSRSARAKVRERQLEEAAAAKKR